MNLRLRIVVLLLFVLSAGSGGLTKEASKKQVQVYYPPSGDAWQRKSPEALGMNSALLDQAVAYAKTQPSTIPRDFST